MLHFKIQIISLSSFNVKKLRARCSPVYPFENDNYCMARLLSKQEEFTNQISMLETVIWEPEVVHKCIFLPRFHRELNPIEMVRLLYLLRYSLIYFLSTVLLGMGQVSVSSSQRSKTPKTPRRMLSTRVLSR